MQIGSISSLNLREIMEELPVKSSRGENCPPGVRRAGKMKGLLEQEDEQSDESVEEFDELDTNKDGVVDSLELQAAGINPNGEFQTTEDFLNLFTNSNME